MNTTSTQKLLTLLFATVCLAFSAQAQVSKFGKTSDEEMKMSTYSQDTSAAAVVLFDTGEIDFIYGQNGFEYIFKHHKRIKILKKAGYEWANMAIPYYQSSNGKEKVINVKGFTYNQNGSEITKDKLTSSGIFDEKISDNWNQKKITLPNVKEGSVIDISYEIRSDFLYNLRDWEFQSTIPVIHSQYRVVVPEYFVYKLNQQGYLGFAESKQDPARGTYSIPGNSEKIEAETKVYFFSVKHAPALRAEKYITTLNDYQTKISFELQSTRFPNTPFKIMTGDWANVTKDLLNEENFGRQLKRRNNLKADADAIASKYTNAVEKMAAVHAFVKNTVKWNGKYGSIYTQATMPKIFETKAGSATEVNMLLTAMLLEAGLDAAPVLVSTREHGRVNTNYSPMLSKFNYVVTHVSIDGKDYLLDATDPYLTVNMLPVRCLNGEGRLIKEQDQRWVSLQSKQPYSKLVSTDVVVKESGELIGKAIESASGYNALALRKTIKESGEEKFAEARTKEMGDFKLGKPVILNQEDINAALQIQYDINGAGNEQSNDVIYLSPLLGQGDDENPFKLTERLYPVDFATTIDETLITNFTLPDGYVVEDMPKNVAISLPENGGRFTFMLQKEGNRIQVMSKVSINKPVFYAQEYMYLKEFYNHIVAKHAEMIVIKKASSN